MRKLTVPGVIVAAVLVLGVLFALPAGASTVGDMICGTDDAAAACSNPSPATGDFDGFDPSYHCNNVLYTGDPDNFGFGFGERSGATYYAVGDLDTSENPATSPHNAPHQGDCDNDTVAGVIGTDDETNDLEYNENSIILLRATHYWNLKTLDSFGDGHWPPCPNYSDRNPGCPDGASPGEDAGYVGLGGPAGSATGDTSSVNGGLKGDFDP